MKVTAAVSAALIGRAAAQAALVNSVLSDIQTAIQGFDSAIGAYTGGPTTALEAASAKINSAVTGGAAKISGGSELALTDTLSITGNVSGLQNALDSALAKLTSITPKLAAAGECAKTVSILEGQQAGAKALQDAVASKSPESVRSLAAQLGGKVGESIQGAAGKIKADCTDAAPKGGAAAPPSSGSSSSSSGSTAGSAPAAPLPGTGSATKTYGDKPAVTSKVPSPAAYTGAASANRIPSALAVGAVAAYLAM